DQWVQSMKAHGAPHYSIKAVRGGQEAVHLDGAPFMTLMPGMFDYDLRIKAMNEAKVDLAVVTLTCPNIFWGGREASAQTARAINDSMASAQTIYPDRIRWIASLPWQYPADALVELQHAKQAGAVGIITLANIAGEQLTVSKFAPIWAEIERLDLPVFI